MRNLEINKKKLFTLSNIGITLCTICTIGTGIIAYNNSKAKKTLLNEPIRGCDISSHQVYTNWDEINNNYDFVIIKATNGNEVDSKFNDNYNEAKMQNIDIGVYSYNVLSANNTQSFEDFKNGTNIRIDKLLDTIKNKRINYPVYLDIEFLETPINEALPKEYANYLVNTFYNKMLDNRYIAGIYSNKSTYDYLRENVDIFDKLEVWVAGGDTYDDIISIEKTESNNRNYSNDIKMVQSYQYVVNGGAGDSFGHLDVDYSYIDYYDRKIDYKDLGIAITSFGAGGLILYKKKKN